MKPILHLITWGFILSTGTMVNNAWAVTDEQIASAVLGEALHDKTSMQYMAHAVINRTAKNGSFKGIYGYEVARTMSYGPKTCLEASNAVKMARVEADPTAGATHWLSDYDLAHCRPERMSWRYSMVETAYQGQTHYYKELNR